MKWFSVLAIASLLAVAVFTAMPAPAARAADPISWHVNSCRGSTCPPDTVGDLEYSYDGTAISSLGDLLAAKIVCTGVGCTQEADVYFLVMGEVSWMNDYDFGARTLHVTTNGQETEVECGTGLDGHCFFHAYGVIDAGDINPDPGISYHVLTAASIAPGATGDDYDFSVQITYSTDPINVSDCDSDYMDVQFVVEAGSFSATDESGVQQTLTEGLLYRLTVYGGPWQSEFEGENRYDSAIKLGEDDWRNTNDLAGDTDYVECVQHSPEDVHEIEFVFSAPDADFSIRVNDLVGEFADNLGLMNYSIAEVQPTGGGCEGQYLRGGLLGSFNLAATNAAGVNLSSTLGQNYPAAGEWFIVEVTGGYWKNNGSGDDLRDLGIKHGIGGFWYPLQSYPFEACEDLLASVYYVQMPAVVGALYMRVYDTDANFPANTGTLSITIYGVASYTPYPSGCELNYTVGDFIETKTVLANMSNGLQLDQNGREWDPYNVMGGEWEPTTPKRYYMLETYGGPAYLGAEGYSWSVDLAQLDDRIDITPDPWYFMATAPFVECDVLIDSVGHERSFFAIDEQVDLYEFIRYWYAIRVRDTGSYSDNSGSMSYRLYMATNNQVVDPGVVPPVDGCIQFQHDATPTGTVTIQAVQSNGSALPSLASNTIYALIVTGGPWLDDGADSYDVQLSDDGGDTWVDLASYPYLLCSQSEDGDHVTIYLQGAAGKSWRARADDGNSDFTDNTLTITMTVYPGQSDVDPWPTCDDNYNLTLVALGEEQRTVPGELAGGKTIPTIVVGKTYAVEITGEAMWYETGDPDGSYLVDISDDGGVTWVPLEEYGEACSIMVGNGGRFQTYFTATSANYKLRVRDGDDDFLSNTGQVKFELYTADDITNPPGDDGDPPPDWVVACDEIQTRPDGVISWQSGTLLGVDFNYPVPMVAEWVMYAKWSVTYFLAWCPEHTEALKSSADEYLTREPVASFLTLRDFIQDISTTISTYQSTMGGEGEAAGVVSQEPDFFSDISTGVTGGETNDVTLNANPFNLLNENTSESIWFGGQIDLTQHVTGDTVAEAAFANFCTTKFESVFGIITNPFCNILGLMRSTKIATRILFVVDVVALVVYVKYFISWVKRMWDEITGSKGAVKSIVRGL